MNPKSSHGSTNRRVRALVGMMLAAMICVLCGRFLLPASENVQDQVAVDPVVAPVIEAIAEPDPAPVSVVQKPVAVQVEVATVPEPQAPVEPAPEVVAVVVPKPQITPQPRSVPVADVPAVPAPAEPLVSKPAPAPAPAPQVAPRSVALPLLESTAIASQGPLQRQAKIEAVDQVKLWAQSDHVALLKHCLTHFRRNYSSYTVRLTKQERLRGRLGKQQVVDVKFMPQPFSVAMAWVQNSGDGDRMLYIDGKYENKMVVRPASAAIRWLIPSVTVSLDDKAVKAASLRTVDQFGFENGLQELLKVYEQASASGELKQEYGGYVKIDGRPAIKLIRHLPQRNDYPAGLTEIYIDTEYLVPVCIKGYGWDTKSELLCTYTYTNIDFNAVLTADDFLPANNGIKGRK